MAKIKKIIASDIDGTLLPYGERNFNPRLFELINTLTDLGVLFVPASGRTIQSLMSLFKPVKDKISFLSENGGVVWVGKTPIVETPIPLDLLIEIADLMKSHPDMICYITSMDRSFVYSDDINDVIFFNENVLPNSEQLLSLKDLNVTPLKVTAFCKDDFKNYIDLFTEKFGGRANIMPAGPTVIDLGIANKGYGLKILTEYFNLTPEDVYAFGDNYNDKSMLEYATHSFIMKTEDPVLLKSARNVCEDVVEELEKIVKELKESAETEN